MTLCFDTETTGHANVKAPADHASQPKLVQLGAILFDQERRIAGEMNVIIRPDGFTIPAEAAAVHGITQERALAYGVPFELATDLFVALANRAKLFVAHNYPFDELVMAAAFHRKGAPELADALTKTANFCTMRATTPLCKLPGKYGDYKWPKLQEAHKHLFGEEFDGAHDAMADVRACARVYWALNPLPKVETQPTATP